MAPSDSQIRNIPPSGHQKWSREGFTITTDPGRIDRSILLSWFDNSEQTKSMPPEAIELMVSGSLNFGLLSPTGDTVGYGRLVTDYATFAYLGDVFLLEPYRGKGLGGWFFDTIFAHPDCQALRRWLLMCGEGNVPLYEKYGFKRADGSAGGYALHKTDTQIYVTGQGKTGHPSG